MIRLAILAVIVAIVLVLAGVGRGATKPAPDPFASLGKPTIVYDAYQFDHYWHCRGWFNKTTIKAVCLIDAKKDALFGKKPAQGQA